MTPAANPTSTSSLPAVSGAPAGVPSSATEGDSDASELQMSERAESRVGDRRTRVPEVATAGTYAYLLGDGPLQRRLAAELGIGVIARPVVDDPTPLVVLAERAPDVQAIAQARSWAPIRVVIAWALPESALLRLLDLDLPILVGLPTAAQLQRALNEGDDGLDRSAERRRAGRLAAVEASLGGRGRADTTTVQHTIEAP